MGLKWARPGGSDGISGDIIGSYHYSRAGAAVWSPAPLSQWSGSQRVQPVESTASPGLTRRHGSFVSQSRPGQSGHSSESGPRSPVRNQAPVQPLEIKDWIQVPVKQLRIRSRFIALPHYRQSVELLPLTIRAKLSSRAGPGRNRRGRAGPGRSVVPSPTLPPPLTTRSPARRRAVSAAPGACQAALRHLFSRPDSCYHLTPGPAGGRRRGGGGHGADVVTHGPGTEAPDR